jgi:hypothetical protein
MINAGDIQFFERTQPGERKFKGVLGAQVFRQVNTDALDHKITEILWMFRRGVEESDFG